jgi:DNA end-binding protein Ku
MRGKQYLAVIRPADRVLILETLYFADEVRDPADVMDTLPRAGKVEAKELKSAGNLIQQLTTPWKPEQYHDTYRESVLAIVKRKAKGEEIEVEEDEDAGGEVLDLMEALEQSLARAKGRKSTAKRPAKKAAAKKAPAKKSAAKKSSAKKAPAKTAAKRSTAKKSTAKKATAKKTAKRQTRKAS